MPNFRYLRPNRLQSATDGGIIPMWLVDTSSPVIVGCKLGAATVKPYGDGKYTIVCGDPLDKLGVPAFDPNKPYESVPKQMPTNIQPCKQNTPTATVCRNHDGSLSANPQYMQSLPDAK